MKIRYLFLVILLLSRIMTAQKTTLLPQYYCFSPYIFIILTSLVETDEQGENAVPTKLVELIEQTKLTSARLAFIAENKKGEPSWEKYPLDFAASTVKTLKQRGIDIIISLGGGLGKLPGSKSGTVTSFYNALAKIVALYPNCPLDLDIEQKDLYKWGGGADKVKLANLFKAVARIQKEHQTPVILTIPVEHQGLAQGGKDIIEQAKKAGVTFKVNIMAMFYEPTLSLGLAEAAQSAATSTVLFLHSLYPQISEDACLQLVEITPMIGYNKEHHSNLIFHVSDALELAQWATQKKVTLSMWSLSRDKPGQKGIVTSLHSGLEDHGHYAFSKAFLMRCPYEQFLAAKN